MVALIFPGQGSEEPGMGLARAASDPEAAALLQAASDAVGVDVRRAIERGSRALARTEVLQPALVAVGWSAARALVREGGAPSVVAGHSLGELTAACWAAGLAPVQAVELAAARGALMAEAAAEAVGGPGAMIALRSCPGALRDRLLERGAPPLAPPDARDEQDREPAEGWLAQIERSLPRGVSVAAINAPDEIVLGGGEGELSRLVRRLRLPHTRLRAAGAWHTERLRPAVAPFEARLRRALGGAALGCPLVSGVTGGPVGAGALISVLGEGLVRPVRFVDALGAVEARGAGPFALAAPSRTIRSLIRRCLGAVEVRCGEEAGGCGEGSSIA